MAELGYFEQSAADSKAFVEMVNRYGVAGVLSALQNTIRSGDYPGKCSNKCSLGVNIVWELQRCSREIENWAKEAK